MSHPFGFLNINKPLGLTSHDVVAKVRRALKIKKVGHAGTLDPLATGVLVVCVGGATRLSEYAMATTKRYVARVKLGETTQTYDAEGEVLQRTDASHITPAMIEAALPQFLGEIDQLPPMYSAIKQGGRKLYELARAGETVTRTPRRVRIDALTLTGDLQLPEFELAVVCSAGTYIRSLAYDLGEALGVGAHLTGLTRTASGAFTLENAVTLDALVQSDDPTAYLLPPETVMGDWEVVPLTDDTLADILQGRSIPASVDCDVDALGRAVSPQGRTVAIVQWRTGRRWHPHKVFV